MTAEEKRRQHALDQEARRAADPEKYRKMARDWQQRKRDGTSGEHREKRQAMRTLNRLARVFDNLRQEFR